MKHMFVRLDVSTVCSTVCIYYILLMYVDVEMHGCRVVEHCTSASTWPLKFYDLISSDCAIVILCLFLFPSFPGEFLGGF